MGLKRFAWCHYRILCFVFGVCLSRSSIGRGGDGSIFSSSSTVNRTITQRLVLRWRCFGFCLVLQNVLLVGIRECYGRVFDVEGTC